jgi:hypothetical protein
MIHPEDVGVAHVLDVWDEGFRELTIGIETPIRVALPGSCVYFINVDGCVQPVPLPPLFKPGLILPVVPGGFGNARCSARTPLEPLRIGIRLDQV